MIVAIEEYRNFQINFCTERDSFLVVSLDDDWQKEKTSYTACKRFIDKFVKDNVEFKPFHIWKSNWGDPVIKEKFLAVGIRKDDRLVIEPVGGGKPISIALDKSYDIKDYYFVEESNESKVLALRSEIDLLYKDFKLQEKDRTEKIQKLITPLKDYMERDKEFSKLRNIITQ